MIKEKILDTKNISKFDGKYMLVSHEHKTVIGGFDTVTELLNHAYGLSFGLIDIGVMKAKYRELFLCELPSDPTKRRGRYEQVGEAEFTCRIGGPFLAEDALKHYGEDRPLTRRDLELEYWGPLHDKVNTYNLKHNCDVKPWECVKHIVTKFEDHPKFLGEPKHYRIAVAILYDERVGLHKPVFLGDPIYSKSGETFDWNDPDYLRQITHPINCWIWTPPKPKREFEINGEKLPCPLKQRTPSAHGQAHVLHYCGDIFYFGERIERDRVRNAIRDLLIGARDK